MSTLTSVIIPTFNRPKQLARLLDSVEKQTLAPDDFEVIVVDDGSSEDYSELANHGWMFCLRYVKQPNAGEAVARNLGVTMATSGFIVFLDDDMVVVPEYLEALHSEHCDHPSALLLGTMLVPKQPDGTVFQQVTSASIEPGSPGPVPFTAMAAGVLSLNRDLYQELGGMQPIPDPERGGWMDLAFAYRAYQAGHQFRRCAQAIAYHHDYTIATREAGARRMYKISALAPSTFAQVPGLKPHVAMFRDKEPVDWPTDPPQLMFRKLARTLLSSGPSLEMLEWLAGYLEGRYPDPRFLGPLYRWIMGAYIFRGYRDGLRDLSQQV